MEEIKIGSAISFGDYNWRVLDIQNNRALIITESMVGQHSYNDYAGDVTWAECSLRKYLNGEFYDNFTEAEQSRIVPVLIKNDGNVGIQGNGTFRYNSNTIHPLTSDNKGGVRPVLWLKLEQ